jgi:hypothetical protein
MSEERKLAAILASDVVVAAVTSLEVSANS